MPIWPFFGEIFENWNPAFSLTPAFLGCFLSEKVFLKRQTLLIMSSDRPKRQTTMSSFLRDSASALPSSSSASDLPTSARAEVPARTYTSWHGDRGHIAVQVFHGRGHLRKFRPPVTYDQLYRSLYLVYLRQRDLCNGLSIQAARSWCAAEHPGLSVTRQYENLRTFKRHYGLSVRRTTSTAQIVP